MQENNHSILTDSFGREHSYLRMSITERCNFRCTYCMPANGVQLSPKENLMSAEEIETIAKVFVKNGVSKIRLTGGEPLVRKDFSDIIIRLSKLPISLGVTSNAYLIDQYFSLFQDSKVRHINVSLDTLDATRFKEITLRDHFQKTWDNILALIKENFKVKINVVLMKGVNDDEIIDFIELTKTYPVSVRFIEFMPFNGNQWDISKTVPYLEIMNNVEKYYGDVVRLNDAPNDTSKNYKIGGYQGTFGIISSVTNPFCDSCNRLRVTANGRIKNCLFSSNETDLLKFLRNGESIEPIIGSVVKSKLKIRGGMDSLEKLKEPSLHSKNRSMITIGG